MMRTHGILHARIRIVRIGHRDVTVVIAKLRGGDGRGRWVGRGM